MDANEQRKREMDTLIEAIWGAPAVVPTVPPDPAARVAQNLALAQAMRTYLQQYLAEVEADPPLPAGEGRRPHA